MLVAVCATSPLWGAGGLFLSCSDGVATSKYASLPARFTFSPVSSQPQLFTACHSMGEWCMVTAKGKQYLFTRPDGSQGVANQTALTGYTGFYMGLSGFIVGLPNIPEMGTDAPVVTCYDRACPNCYEQDHVTKPLAVHTDGTAACAKCQRMYDLNNTGLITHGPAGRTLYRYRVYMGADAIAINN